MLLRVNAIFGDLQTCYEKFNMKNYLKNGGLVAAGLVFTGVASAVVDPAVTTAISAAGADSAVVGVAVLVVIVGIYAFKLLRRAL
jgi:hypothetical protein